MFFFFFSAYLWMEVFIQMFLYYYYVSLTLHDLKLNIDLVNH